MMMMQADRAVAAALESKLRAPPKVIIIIYGTFDSVPC